MKKSKILMPILGVGAVTATVAPMIAMTSCSKKAEFKAGEAIVDDEYYSSATFVVTWTNFKGEDKEDRNITSFDFDANKSSFTTNIKDPYEEFVWGDVEVTDLSSFAKKGSAQCSAAWLYLPLEDEGEWIKAKLCFNYTIQQEGKDDIKSSVMLNVTFAHPTK